MMKIRGRDGTMREEDDTYILADGETMRGPVSVHGCEAHGPRRERSSRRTEAGLFVHRRQ